MERKAEVVERERGEVLVEGKLVNKYNDIIYLGVIYLGVDYLGVDYLGVIIHLFSNEFIFITLSS
jgi:hypothetical protein